MRQKRVQLLLTIATSLSLSCSNKTAGQVTVGDSERLIPVWHFEPIDHRQGDMTLTDLWGRSDGAVFVVGWYGTIFTNRPTTANPDGLWVKMDSGTVEHLTAIWGIENGGRFHQHNVDGEMFAVGWNGTLLYYHPNPSLKQNPVPEDGAWQVIAGPGVELTPRTKVDPKCPDFDGDGIPDDGGGGTPSGGDGWWSPDQTCKSGATTACDDNCRTTANGPDRPIRDVSGPQGHSDGCLNPADGDGPYPASGADTRNQVDLDGDGIGRDCDANDSVADVRPPFRPTFFDVWADANNGQDVVVVVGENGAVVTYTGPDATTVPPAPGYTIVDRRAWTAQDALTYRYDNDCPVDTVGATCAGAVRLPPACPALCHPFRNPCDCPPAQGQCCVAGATAGAYSLVGAACGDNSCPAVTNACDATAGTCSTNCPGCFRRLDKTLRSVASDGTNVVAVGASGTVVKLPIDLATPATLHDTWSRPDCIPMPYPLDGRPVLAAIAQRGGTFLTVGAGGTYATVDPAAATCGLATLPADTNIPPAFLTGIFPLGGDHAFVVGDSGIFMELNGRGQCTPSGNGPVAVITTELPQNINSLWVTNVNGVQRIWFVGATGTVIRAGCYP